MTQIRREEVRLSVSSLAAKVTAKALQGRKPKSLDELLLAWDQVLAEFLAPAVPKRRGTGMKQR